MPEQPVESPPAGKTAPQSRQAQKPPRPWWYLRPAYVAVAACVSFLATGGIVEYVLRTRYDAGWATDTLAFLASVVAAAVVKTQLDRAMMDYHQGGGR
jgi:hypothetical protein